MCVNAGLGVIITGTLRASWGYKDLEQNILGEGRQMAKIGEISPILVFLLFSFFFSQTSDHQDTVDPYDA